MKLLQITASQMANLETATMVSPEDEGGAIRFYFPAVEMYWTDHLMPGIRIETAMMNSNDLVVWVQPEHPKFAAVHDWLNANSF